MYIFVTSHFTSAYASYSTLKPTLFSLKTMERSKKTKLFSLNDDDDPSFT